MVSLPHDGTYALGNAMPAASEHSTAWWWTLRALVAWPLLIAASIGQDYLAGLSVESPVDARESLSFALFQWVPWAFLSPFLFRFLCAMPLLPEPSRRRVVSYVAAAAVFTSAQTSLQALAKVTWLDNVQQWTYTQWFFCLAATKLHIELLTFAAFALIFHVVVATRSAVANASRARELEHSKMQLELHALRSQLEPHFLFNALNSLCALLPEGGRAHAMAIRLSIYLRKALEGSTADLVPLATEIEMAQAYLGVEEVRFGTRLRVEWHVECAATSQYVPALILQPLVENAVRHGLGRTSAPVTIRIASRIEEHTLVIEVANDVTVDRDGGSPTAGSGVGLQNVRARLRALYEHRAHLETRMDQSQFITMIRIDLQAA